MSMALFWIRNPPGRADQSTLFVSIPDIKSEHNSSDYTTHRTSSNEQQLSFLHCRFSFSLSLCYELDLSTVDYVRAYEELSTSFDTRHRMMDP